MHHRLLATLLVLIHVAVLMLGMSTASLTTSFRADSAYAESYFAGFRELEHNQTTAYRWSYTESALMLAGYERLPLLVDLRLTSPRPVDEPAADIGLARGRWVMPRVPVQGDWRHYYFLIPARDYQPELSLISTMFRPDERDKRSLGVAVSRVGLSVPALPNPLLANLLALGPWRIALILLFALLLYATSLRLSQAKRYPAILPFLISCISFIPSYVLAHNPLQAAIILPDAWRLPLLTAGLLLIWAVMRPWLKGMQQNVLLALNHDRWRPIIVLCIACIFGLIMIFAVPPWEQQDEGAHFEFAWLIANHPTWPVPGTSDPRMAITNGQGRALHHQPLYYVLVSLALSLSTERPILDQLLIGRAVSLLLFLGIAFMAERTAQTIFPKGHILRWFAPLAIVLCPSFANIMTSVNNDVGVTFVCSFAVLMISRVLMQGITWSRMLALLGSIPVAMQMKNTGAVLIAIVPIVFFFYFWRQRGLPRRMLLLPAAIVLVLLISMLSWSDPAHWYRWESAMNGGAMRTVRPEAPLGPHVLRMDAVATPNYEGLSTSIPDIGMVANRQITVGAWVWASRPASVWVPGVVYQPRENENRLEGEHRQVNVDTQPRWFAWTYDIPTRLLFVHIMAWSVAPDDTLPLEIYVDGIVAVPGEFPLDAPPTFSDTSAQHGDWGGRPFTNLIKNGGFEQGWVFLRPEVNRLVATYARRSPSRIIASFADPLTSLRLELRDYIPWMMFMAFGIYGRSILREPIWQYMIPVMVSAGIVGLAWLGWKQRKRDDVIAFTCRVLGLICLGTWSFILVAHLPVSFPGGIPSSRYGFTMVIPSALLLCMGWLALWPRILRTEAAISLLTTLLILDIAAISTIRLFENSLCVREPMRCMFSPVPQISTQPDMLALFAMLFLLFLFVHWIVMKFYNQNT